MHAVWDKYYTKQHDRKKVTTPVYIASSAAFKATHAEATKLGIQYHHLVATMECFYCEVYNINEEDQPRFKGRGEACTFQEKEVRESGARRVTYTNKRTN
eukprot:3894095-Pyramimonas_sp.AAC.1